jgi:hypothetical protein
MKDRSAIAEAIQPVIIELVIFFYIYSVPLKGIPGGIGTRMLMTVAGFLVFLLTFIKATARGEVRIRKDILVIFFFILALVGISIITNLVNLTGDLAFVKYAGSILYMLLGGYFIIWLLKQYYDELSFSIIGNYIVVAGIIQVLLSLLMFTVPPLYDALYAIQNTDALMNERLSFIGGFRLVGFGSTFFASGIVHGYMLILLAALIRYKANSRRNILFYALAFCLLMVLGTMMARTTMIGGILGLGIIFFPTFKGNSTFSRNVVRFVLSLFLLISVVGLIIVMLPKESRDMLANAWNFGFEMIINYINGEGLRSDSTDELKDMFIWPDNPKTYLIGDAYFTDPDDPGFYYMRTDVGYLRLIYYFGIPGLLIFITLQLLPAIFAAWSYRRNIYILMFFVCSIAYLLILNVKGFTDMFFLNILFLFPISTGLRFK